MKENIGNKPEKKDLDDRDVMRHESLQAIREGNALPTPAFAVEEGREMVTLLTHEIEKLDSKQLDDLMENLSVVRAAKAGEAVDAVRDKLDVLTTKGIAIPLIVGWLIGAVASGTVEGANVGAAVITAGKKALDNVEANRRIEQVQAKAERIMSLIEAVKAKRLNQQA